MNARWGEWRSGLVVAALAILGGGGCTGVYSSGECGGPDQACCVGSTCGGSMVCNSESRCATAAPIVHRRRDGERAQRERADAPQRHRHTGHLRGRSLRLPHRAPERESVRGQHLQSPRWAELHGVGWLGNRWQRERHQRRRLLHQHSGADLHHRWHGHRSDRNRARAAGQRCGQPAHRRQRHLPLRHRAYPGRSLRDHGAGPALGADLHRDQRKGDGRLCRRDRRGGELRRAHAPVHHRGDGERPGGDGASAPQQRCGRPSHLRERCLHLLHPVANRRRLRGDRGRPARGTLPDLHRLQRSGHGGERQRHQRGRPSASPTRCRSSRWAAR